jgi:hypothetical protein
MESCYEFSDVVKQVFVLVRRRNLPAVVHGEYQV